MTPGPIHVAFTVKYQGRSLKLTSEVEIFPAFLPPNPPHQGGKYTALYDTGATHCAISPRIVADFQLPSIGARKVGVGGGEIITTSHLVNIGLPNRAMFPMVAAAKMILPGGVDALIGMDILGLGDFAVTHYGGITTFSFCCPPRKQIDFVSEVEALRKAAVPKVGRNDLCPCGTGKKYKKCHGS